MNTCPICLSAFLQSWHGPQGERGAISKYECGTNVVRINGAVTDCMAAPECLSGANLIHDTAQALYDAFGYDSDSACTPEQRMARKQWRRITMDRDGKECVE
ncbi:MAG: hypothetical protein JW395_3790 [Nitrospira sp.]|jgi:hypothetical protein|nr:hypothetical protein [Nitrospira sp.]